MNPLWPDTSRDHASRLPLNRQPCPTSPRQKPRPSHASDARKAPVQGQLMPPLPSPKGQMLQRCAHASPRTARRACRHNLTARPPQATPAATAPPPTGRAPTPCRTAKSPSTRATCSVCRARQQQQHVSSPPPTTTSPAPPRHRAMPSPPLVSPMPSSRTRRPSCLCRNCARRSASSARAGRLPRAHRRHTSTLPWGLIPCVRLPRSSQNLPVCGPWC